MRHEEVVKREMKEEGGSIRVNGAESDPEVRATHQTVKDAFGTRDS